MLFDVILPIDYSHEISSFMGATTVSLISAQIISLQLKTEVSFQRSLFSC